MLKIKAKQNYPSPEYKKYYYLRVLGFTIIGLIGAFLIGGIFFIYTNIYVTLGGVKTTLYLNSNLSIEVIDFNRYDKVKSAWQEKNDLIKPLPNKDPFSLSLENLEIEKETNLNE